MENSAREPFVLYTMTYSGHGHRVELMLSLLSLPYEKINVDPHDGKLQTLEFLEMNPFGQIPVIIDGQVVVYDSNAILVYLAKTYGESHWMPQDPQNIAKVQQWLSLAAGQIAFGPCAARRLCVYGEKLIPMESALIISKKLFATLEIIFSLRSYCIGDDPTVADIAAYTYIAHAPEGGLHLTPYPMIRAWLRRVESLPGFLFMPKFTH